MERKIGVVIGAGEDAIHAIEKAKEYGVFVIAIDGNPQAAGFKYADKSIEVDISDKEKVCKVIEQEKPDFIIPIPIGRYLSIIGYVNERYGLKGIKYNATKLSTDKYLFHKKLEMVGLRNIQMHLINKEADINKIDMVFPAIMKPRFGSGSRDVFYLTDKQEMIEAYRAALTKSEDFILEQAVQGIEYSVDGAVIGRKLNITLLRKKIITPLPIRQPISSFSVIETEENKKLLNRVFKYLQEVVNALGYDDCLINADLVVNQKEIFVIEMVPRPSGHNLHSIFVPMATGVDLVGEYIKFLLGEQAIFEKENIRCIQIRFFDFEEVVIEKVPLKEELELCGKCNLLLWNCNIKENEYMNKVINGHSIMGRGFFIVEGKNEEDLLSQSNWILSKFKCRRE